MTLRFLVAITILAGALTTSGAESSNRLAFASSSKATFGFTNWVGQRITENIHNWLRPAPLANPGMLEMFRARDRTPTPQLVPWAGEFVGKYLVSAIQSGRIAEDPPLKKIVSNVVAQLIATQAEDGYLGPFPKTDRLLGNWDLWGHYHCLLGLMLWHEETGDRAALDCARRAADLACATYLDTARRPVDAGSDEMNLAIIHGLGLLHRLTGEPRYARLMREIEKDWERAGDYFRTGLSGVEFFRTPRPRWESLHNLQGLVELFLISGDTRYRDAFEHHWRSIARWDVRNTGGFSSGEQATGNPYASTPIETCCTIAWMALTMDMLRLSGDVAVADAIELSTFNAAAGAQHPSGRWWTYNTPMDGQREASAHTIVFQARPGTPELNCCSVNGPRAWSMLSEWALMSAPDGTVVNYFAPFHGTIPLAGDSTMTVQCTGDYPRTPEVTLRATSADSSEQTLHLRIPAWSTRTQVTLNGQAVEGVRPGQYLKLRRAWTAADTLRIDFDLSLRAVAGAREARDRVSLYRGPILLAWDARLSNAEEAKIPRIDLDRLETSVLNSEGVDGLAEIVEPVLSVNVPAENGATLRLVDFASAGATGSRYRSWLVGSKTLPPPSVTKVPRDGAVLPRGQIAFSWTGPGPHEPVRYRLRISDQPEGNRFIAESALLSERQTVLDTDARFRTNRWYYWEVVTTDDQGATSSTGPRARFRVDNALPHRVEQLKPPLSLGPRGELVSASLHGTAKPDFGVLNADHGYVIADGRDDASGKAIGLDGKSQRLIYQVGEWPEEDYSVAVWVRARDIPTNRLAQIVSAWSRSSDDPLRICFDKGRLFARIEAGAAYTTPGTVLQVGQWHHVAAVKSGGRLRLFVDGRETGGVDVPISLPTLATDFALGGNPHYQGNEYLAADFAALIFVPRAWTREEVNALKNSPTR